ncbi:MAG: hypothetical protein WA798_13540 [Candidatus Acidiferrum sp.]
MHEIPASRFATAAANHLRPSGRLRSLRTVFLLGLLAAFASTSTLAAPPQKHPFTIDDYSALHSARARAISPDGKTILYDVSTDGKKGPTKHDWHLIDVSGENARQLDLPEKFQPFGFTKDGSVYGALPVNDAGQLAIVPLSGAKPTVIIALPKGTNGAAISPDG